MTFPHLDLDAVDAALDRHGYLIVRNDELTALCAQARADYVRFFEQSKPKPPRESFDFRHLAREPWRKYAIGSHIGLGDPYAQNLQSSYFDYRDRNYPQLGELFAQLLAIRNHLMRLPKANFGEEAEQDRFWNACRIHHYPRGGGFMAKHCDTYFPTIIKEQMGKPFYQVSALLSRKGEHFATGGGFVVDRQGKKIDLETEAGFGTMVIFDGKTPHGVDDVDPDQIINFDRSDGRLAAFVNLYEVRSPNPVS